jgi:hypothetical protein
MVQKGRRQVGLVNFGLRRKVAVSEPLRQELKQALLEFDALELVFSQVHQDQLVLLQDGGAGQTSVFAHCFREKHLAA